MKSMKSLDLSFNAISDAGAVFISRMHGIRELISNPMEFGMLSLF